MSSSEVIQPETVRELDQIIQCAYIDAGVLPGDVDAVVPSPSQNGKPPIQVSRREGHNLLQLLVCLENGDQREIIQVHMIGMYATGSVCTLDPNGQTDFSTLNDDELKSAIATVRFHQDVGDFKPKRFKKLLSFLRV